MDIIQQIKSRVKENDNGCWIWCGPKGDDGYGLIRVPPRRTRRVHRVMYEAFNGEIGGLLVCHKCDTPLCVNPEHLFLGTPKQNTHDAMNKGRLNRGESVNTSKLTESQVVEISEKHFYGEPIPKLANEYGMSLGGVRMLLAGKTWRTVSRKVFEFRNIRNTAGQFESVSRLVA